MYIIPTIPNITEFANKVYIDPTATPGGTGTEASPLLDYPSTFAPNTAYLQKVGTSLPNKRIVVRGDNNYFGKYGTGAKPIVGQGFSIQDGSHNITIDGLDLRKDPTEPTGTDFIVEGLGSNNTNWNIANCIIQGNYKAVSEWTEMVILTGGVEQPVPVHYPIRGIRCGNVTGFTIYHNEIKNTHNDGIWLGSCPNLKIVNNWIYDINRGGYRESTNTYYRVGGDCIQLEYSYLNLYLAGNRLDKSLTDWKFAFIINSAWDNTNRNIIAEYNTLIGSKSGYGGAVVYWNSPQNSIFRRNIVDASNGGVQLSGVVPFSSSSTRIRDHFEQAAPYGIRENHIIKSTTDWSYPNYTSSIDASNNKFNTYAEYLAHIGSVTEQANWGSDIVTANFWAEPAPKTPTVKLDIRIIGNGTILTSPFKAEYEVGEVISHLATPDPGWEFSHWTKDGVKSTNPTLNQTV